MKRSGPPQRDPEKVREFNRRGRQASARRARRPVSPASPAQREQVRDVPCLVCGDGPCDPAHLWPRSLGGDDDPRAVVALCRIHHRAFDAGELDLLPSLLPDQAVGVAYAVELADGDVHAVLERLTGTAWVPVSELERRLRGGAA